jgi:hypothetical protein
VDDIFPVVFRRVKAGLPGKARLFRGEGADMCEAEVPEDKANPRLWKKLGSINSKLGLLMYGLEISDAALSAEASGPQSGPSWRTWTQVCRACSRGST